MRLFHNPPESTAPTIIGDLQAKHGTLDPGDSRRGAPDNRNNIGISVPSGRAFSCRPFIGATAWGS